MAAQATMDTETDEYYFLCDPRLDVIITTNLEFNQLRENRRLVRA
jgi:hypothetical protein